MHVLLQMSGIVHRSSCLSWLNFYKNIYPTRYWKIGKAGRFNVIYHKFPFLIWISGQQPQNLQTGAVNEEKNKPLTGDPSSREREGQAALVWCASAMLFWDSYYATLWVMREHSAVASASSFHKLSTIAKPWALFSQKGSCQESGERRDV